MNRRAFLGTVLGVPITGAPLPAAGARLGVHLTGRFDAPDTERSEHVLNFGRAFALEVNDAALWSALQPLIGPEIQISIFQP